MAQEEHDPKPVHTCCMMHIPIILILCKYM